MVKELIFKIVNKRKKYNECTKEASKYYKQSFSMNFNSYNASLLVCALAYLRRQLYYGRVEDVRFEDFFPDSDFAEVFYQLSLMLFAFKGKCENSFENYEEYKILRK